MSPVACRRRPSSSPHNCRCRTPPGRVRMKDAKCPQGMAGRTQTDVHRDARFRARVGAGPGRGGRRRLPLARLGRLGRARGHANHRGGHPGTADAGAPSRRVGRSPRSLPFPRRPAGPAGWHDPLDLHRDVWLHGYGQGGVGLGASAAPDGAGRICGRPRHQAQLRGQRSRAAPLGSHCLHRRFPLCPQAVGAADSWRTRCLRPRVGPGRPADGRRGPAAERSGNAAAAGPLVRRRRAPL